MFFDAEDDLGDTTPRAKEARGGGSTRLRYRPSPDSQSLERHQRGGGGVARNGSGDSDR
jgi:hypothetical protein